MWTVYGSKVVDSVRLKSGRELHYINVSVQAGNKKRDIERDNIFAASRERHAIALHTFSAKKENYADYINYSCIAHKKLASRDRKQRQTKK